MSKLLIFVSFVFSVSIAHSAGIAVGNDATESLSFNESTVKGRRVYVLSYSSSERGNFHRALPRKVLQNANKQIAEFQKILQKRQPATVGFSCNENVVFQLENKKTQTLCASQMTQGERRQLSKWFTENTNLALGKF